MEVARAALEAPSATSARVARALAPDGDLIRRAFVYATLLAATPEAHDDAATVAAALVAGESEGCADAEICAAIAVGCEIAERVRHTLALDAPWDAAVSDRIGAAVAVARVLRLDGVATAHALGLAATQAAELGIAEDTLTDELAHGKAAADALEAVTLARAGFSSAPESLEGRRGLAALMAHGFDEAALCDGLGQHWISVR